MCVCSIYVQEYMTHTVPIHVIYGLAFTFYVHYCTCRTMSHCSRLLRINHDRTNHFNRCHSVVERSAGVSGGGGGGARTPWLVCTFFLYTNERGKVYCGHVRAGRGGELAGVFIVSCQTINLRSTCWRHWRW